MPRLCSAFNLEFDFLGLEREKNQKEPPRDENHHNHERYHTKHPIHKSHTHTHIVQITKGDGVWRGSDRGSYSSDVCCHRNRKCKPDTALAVCRQGFQYRGEEGKHHCSCGRVAHKHGEHCHHAEDAEHHSLRIGTERLEENLRELHIQAHLCRSYRKDEASEEEHYYRIGKSSHNCRIVNENASVIHIVYE